MHTFSHSPVMGLPETGPGQWSEEKLEKNDMSYLRKKNICVLLHPMRPDRNMTHVPRYRTIVCPG